MKSRKDTKAPGFQMTREEYTRISPWKAHEVRAAMVTYITTGELPKMPLLAGYVKNAAEVLMDIDANGPFTEAWYRPFLEER